MKKFFSLLILFLIAFLLLMCVSGCTTNKQVVISTNNYIQTDYDFNCLSDDKTFSAIILCYQKQDKAEKAQNKLTNNMVKKDQK